MGSFLLVHTCPKPIHPLVYAVTYHLSFSSMYTSEWLMISVFLSPLVLLFAGIRYGFARLKQQERQVMK